MSLENIAGIAKEPTVFTPTYPAVSTAVVTELLPLLNEDVRQERDQESVIDRASDSDSFATRLLTLGVSVRGGFAITLSYRGIETLLACALGHQAYRLDGNVQPEDVDSGVAFRHVFEMETDLDKTDWLAGDGFIAGTDGLIAGSQKVRRITYAVNKGPNVWAAKSGYFGALSLGFSPQGPSAEANLVFHSISTNDANNAAISLLSCDHERIVFQDVECYFTPSTNIDPEDPGNLVNIVGINLELDNALSVIHSRHSGLTIEEPRRGAAAVLSGTMAIPRYSTNTLIDAAYGDVPSRLLIVATGPIIPGTTTNYQLRIHLPNIQFTGADVPVDGPDQTSQSYSFVALSTDETVGLPPTSRKGPMVIELINDNNTHTLFP